ncbi:MAG: hypothetical protein ABSE56_12465 [Bryobacteraceae bacterium]|jgi:hypothetical protein
MTRCFLLFASAIALTLSAFAQTKTSGSLDCDKSDPRHVIPIPDHKDHAYVIGQNKCTWTKPIVIEGLEGKGFVNTVFYDVMGASARTTGSGVTTYGSGDKGYTHTSGTADVKAMTSSGKWTFSGGTGKLRGIKGGGTYTCKMKSDEPGSAYTCDVEGEYALPAPKK